MISEIDHRFIKINVELKMLQESPTEEDIIYHASEIWDTLHKNSAQFLQKNEGDRVMRVLRFLVKILNFDPIVLKWVKQWNEIYLNWIISNHQSFPNPEVTIHLEKEDDQISLDADDFSDDENDDENDASFCNVCEVHGHQLWKFNNYACDLCIEDNKEISRKRRRKFGLAKVAQQAKTYHYQI
tara:strand:- start:614 stop:1165 length:552 start_codon:yes stop_codon:yes gene_type:complete